MNTIIMNACGSEIKQSYKSNYNFNSTELAGIDSKSAEEGYGVSIYANVFSVKLWRIRDSIDLFIGRVVSVSVK